MKSPVFTMVLSSDFSVIGSAILALKSIPAEAIVS
jgi:hypothetical protein